MKKILLVFSLLLLFSCSKPDAVVPVSTSYSVALVATCPSTNRTSYCVTKSVYDDVVSILRDNPNQGCVFVQINTISDGVRKGYVLSYGPGCY